MTVRPLLMAGVVTIAAGILACGAPAHAATVAPPLPGPRPATVSTAQPSHGTGVLAIDELPARSGTLEVSSPAFPNGDSIPRDFAADQQNVSPPLDWSAGPAGTQSYAVILEDPDAPHQPFAHWLVWDIPAGTTHLGEGVPRGGDVELPGGGQVRQGRNTPGVVGWFGPKPPVGAPAHHYHFQVFALDTRLTLKGGASLSQLVKAMRGHVLASGQLVGTYQR